ncbi:AT-rich interactive domain-containing protein 1 [Cannabis sativa]|uniref:AT-rich interactive domain-containing protein 1 n=1 Tax=Cannabis sativa TaxID=3483 RepID=UPI0029C9F527|nr:AT-rich interactive domain-containing protein 1 [Cannabis sativa]XP_060969735.1 AT-rich interactive domain-containing protein 1 [Cannabis sativa]
MEYTGKHRENNGRSPKVVRRSPEGHQKPHFCPHLPPISTTSTTNNTGWSILADGSALDHSKNPQELEPTGLLVDFEPDSKGSSKLRRCFYHFHGLLLKEICGNNTLRPIPPILGEGKCADLFELFLAVREKGGCNAVSKNGLWGSVAEESGFGLKFAAAIKLIYIKYLNTFERWLERIVVGSTDLELSHTSVCSDVSTFLMELEGSLNGFLPSSDQNALSKDDSYYLYFDDTSMKSEQDHKERIEDIGSDDNTDDDEMTVVDPATKFSLIKKRKKPEVSDGSLEEVEDEKKSRVMELKLAEGKSSDNSSSSSSASSSSDKEVTKVDSGAAVEEGNGVVDEVSRESFREILNWVFTIAKDPGDPVFGSLPEPSKWNAHGNGEIWKQVLLAREAIFLKRNTDSGSEQKNQRMHPSMYSDQGAAYNLRERLRCRKKLLNGNSAPLGQASSDSSHAMSDLDRSPGHGMPRSEDHTGAGDSSMEHSFIDRYSPSRIPTGPAFQAEVPAWIGETCESDSKWLGSKVWPLNQTEKRFLVERDPIGKGRLENCGCQVPGSTECVRFHIAEKKLRVKRELGSAYHLWRFHNMGEDVTVFWTEAEEKKFKNIVSSNPPSLQKCFWIEICKNFPSRKRADLVSYYYNVFLLRRRAVQNRFTPSNIDSDDDDEESEPALETKGFGQETPQIKQHKK